MRASAGRRYPEFTTKHEATKTEAELAALREKYRNGVPPEIIEHMAGKLADKFIEEGKCGEIMGED